MNPIGRVRVLDTKHILLVDDDVEFTKLLAFLLESRNYRVNITHTGAEALEQCKDKPDLILLDRALPDIEGLEVCRKIREELRLWDIPIIILSGKGMPADKIESLYIGADDYMTKPFDNEELIARIETVLRRRRFSRDIQEDSGALILELTKIIDSGSIAVFFQPIFILPSLEWLGVEVLSRPAADSLFTSSEFLFKAALNFGRYLDLEMLCWHKAIAKWRGSRPAGKIFFNCMPYLIENSRFDGSIFARENISPSDVILEMTERMAIHDYALFLKKVKGLKEIGVKIAIDDVGSGFASLDTIARVKPDFSKIDMLLIRDIHLDPLKQNIVEAIIFFCKKSGIRTIVEGIEKKEELQKVLELGADAAQGYLLARPEQEINAKNAVGH